MKKEIKLTTQCGHIFNYEQMRQFGRDKCQVCGEWIHKEQIINAKIEQIENNLAEIKKLT